MLKTIYVIFLLGIQYHSFSLNTPPDLTAVYDSRKKGVIIKCQNISAGIKTIIIQRSHDNSFWTDIVLKGINQNVDINTFNFEDKQPQTGDNYYRMKCTFLNGKVEYSLVIMVIIGSPGYNWVMYPVPVKDLLTLQYRGVEPISGVIYVVIQSSSGRIITRVRSASLNRILQIPTSNLGSGIYDIRIFVGNEILWNQGFVK